MKKGSIHTSEAIIKMSKAKPGKNHPMYGKKQSKETIEKRRLKTAGQKRSKKTKITYE